MAPRGGRSGEDCSPPKRRRICQVETQQGSHHQLVCGSGQRALPPVPAHPESAGSCQAKTGDSAGTPHLRCRTKRAHSDTMGWLKWRSQQDCTPPKWRHICQVEMQQGSHHQLLSHSGQSRKWPREKVSPASLQR